MIESMQNFLISLTAQAAKGPAGGAPKGGFDPVMIIMMVGMVAVFYFMIIRPQRAQQKKRQEMLDALKPGDKILTNSGIYGTITSMGKTSIRVKVAQGVELRMSRAGIAAKTSKEEDAE